MGELSDFKEQDQLVSSCEVQVKVHSLHGRVLLTNKNQGPKTSTLSKKCEPSQNKHESTQLLRIPQFKKKKKKLWRLREYTLSWGGKDKSVSKELLFRPSGTLNPIASS